MSTSVDDLIDKGQGLADQAANAADGARSAAAPFIKKATAQARDMAGDLSDSIVSYTKNNPAKALGMAAASGALLYVLVKALTTPRD